jgi:hypothetical protein
MSSGIEPAGGKIKSHPGAYETAEGILVGGGKLHPFWQTEFGFVSLSLHYLLQQWYETLPQACE